MFGTAIALSLLQAAGAAVPAKPQDEGNWQLANSSEHCAVHTSAQGGTLVSVFALADREGIGFLLQNRQWTGLKDGEVYPLSIRFDAGSRWPIPALARTDIDEDGPGLFFAIRPGSERGGQDFMSEFASAAGMRVEAHGGPASNVALTGSHGATVALAQCLGRLWGGGESNPFATSAGARTARALSLRREAGADGGTRTRTPRRAGDFKSPASTCSATSARSEHASFAARAKAHRGRC